MEAGYSKSRTYRIWANMKQRCTNPNTPKWHRYGGRGVKVCARWLDSYGGFLSDMGHPPSAAHTLDRIDGDGDYEPGNCRWADRVTQNANRDVTVWVTAFGQTRTIADWSERTGISPITIATRLRRGRTAEFAVSAPMFAREQPGRRRVGAMVKEGKVPERASVMREVRLQLRMNQSDFGRAIGLFGGSVQPAVSAYENGKRPIGDDLFGRVERLRDSAKG